MFKFEILQKSKKSKARIGELKTPNGTIHTPAFIPVATLGTIKGGLDYSEIRQTGIQCQISNTFHFIDMERVDIVKRMGGLHKFSNFPKPIFTDSGGFQVFSLGKGAEYNLGKIQSIFPGENKEIKKQRKGLVKKISEKGVRFLSPRNGQEIFLTPEFSAKTQIKLGADFIYMLDICGSIVDSEKTTAKDLKQTNEWFKRFLKVKIPEKQKVFGIIQGGIFKDLRVQSTNEVNNLDVFGIAIGGALGKDRKEMMKIISWINEKIDWSRPHHLLGIGDIESIPEIIKSGIDLFDCALPTRIARHGIALTKKGNLSIKKGNLKNKFAKLEKTCNCFTCKNYNLAQLNFLAKAKESLIGKLLTIHNLTFLENYLREIRKKIEVGKF